MVPLFVGAEQIRSQPHDLVKEPMTPHVPQQAISPQQGALQQERGVVRQGLQQEETVIIQEESLPSRESLRSDRTNSAPTSLLQPGRVQQEDEPQQVGNSQEDKTVQVRDTPTTAPSLSSHHYSFGCRLEANNEWPYAGRSSSREPHTSAAEKEAEPVTNMTPADNQEPKQVLREEDKSYSEAVIENIERMVISVVKRDTTRVNSEGRRLGRQELYTETVLRDSLRTKRIRHRRHKAAQIAHQQLEHDTNIYNDLFPSFSDQELDNSLENHIPGAADNIWRDRNIIIEDDYHIDPVSVYTTRHGKGGRQRQLIPPPTQSSPPESKPVLYRYDKVTHNTVKKNHKTPNAPHLTVRGYEEGPVVPAKPRGKNTRAKFYPGKHAVDETFIRKMNFKGYQRRTEVNAESFSSQATLLDIQADANNISNDLSGGVEVEFTNYVEEPGPTRSSPEQVDIPQAPPIPTTTPRPSYSTTSSRRNVVTTTTVGYDSIPTTPIRWENTDESTTFLELENIVTIQNGIKDEEKISLNPDEENVPEESKGNGTEGVNETDEDVSYEDYDMEDIEVTEPSSTVKNGTSDDDYHDPAFIPAKLPFGPFLPTARKEELDSTPRGILGVVKKIKPFIMPKVETGMKKPNSGDMMGNILSPLFGVQQQRTKAKGHKLLEYDNERSHNEELYNKVGGSFMPDFDSRTVGYPVESYTSFPLIRRNKYRMFTSSKLHGGFAFIDRKHQEHGEPSIIPPRVTDDSPREHNLVIFGHVGNDTIMDILRNCSRHVTLQLIDHYSLEDLIRETSNPMRQLIVYFNLKSVNYESYNIVLERTKRILDHLSMSQGGLTIYTVIPTEANEINTTRSKEVKTQLLNLNDAILDYCAQDYPTCYTTYNLASITRNLERTYNKDSGFDVYDLGGRSNEACASNEVCGTASPTAENPGSSTKTLASPEQQLNYLGEAVCRSSYHLVMELEANMPTFDYEDYARALENIKEESMRVRAQTGLVLHDILPRDLKKYDKNRPPKYEGQATIVYFHVTVLSVDSINEESMTYVADIFLAQSWRDHRLRLPENMTEEYRILDVEWLHNIWRPDCFFKNAKRVTFHEMSVPNHYLWLYHDKTLLYMAKLTLVLSCAMKFEAYPHDTQICSMMIESLSHTTHDLVFKWNETDPLVVNPDIELPQLDISRNNTEDCTLTYSTGNFTCLAVVFNLRRRLGYHLFHTYVPSAITVVMSWISFWIKPEAIPARVTLGVTSLLTLATQNQQSQSSLPPVSYIKAIDVWMSSCTVFVFASLLQFGIVNYFMEAEPLTKDMTGYSVEDLTDIDEKKSEDGRLNGYSRSRSRSRSRLRSHSPGVPQYVVHRCSGKDIAIYIDKFSRFFFPFSFFVLNVSYWTTYGTM
ncbi:uncharacterized protein LOC121856030 [Homarus americanus]|uniref:uncharacterized protein LOC121856030 n=1 Tax=Homarus americanus TaxID=6706 RepID=UPI001C4578BD|nr:uncharacterized protein LOC121856030 [Homarus americanus]